MVSIKYIFEFVLLGVMGIEDLKKQEFHTLWCFVFMIAGIGFCLVLYGFRHLLVSVVCGIWIVLIGILIRKITRKGIGGGDVWILAILPLWENDNVLWTIYVLAIVLSGIYSAVITIWKQTQKTIAFIPWIGVADFFVNGILYFEGM